MSKPLKTKSLMDVNTNRYEQGLEILAGSSRMPTDRALDVPVIAIPLESIEEREINEFQDIDTDLLELSIEYGSLIHPIAVASHEGDQKYKIISGHRRFRAFTHLNELHPEDGKYSYIPASVYIVTNDPKQLARGGQYISAETEEAMYRDANLQARQISRQEAMKHIDYLIDNIEDHSDELQKKYKTRYGDRERYTEKGDISYFISTIMTDELKIKGYSRETIRKYIKIRKESPSLAKNIRDGNITIYAAYKMLTQPGSRRETAAASRNLNKVKQQLEQFRKHAVNNGGLSEKEKTQIEDIKKEIEMIEKAN